MLTRCSLKAIFCLSLIVGMSRYRPSLGVHKRDSEVCDVTPVARARPFCHTCPVGVLSGSGEVDRAVDGTAVVDRSHVNPALIYVPTGVHRRFNHVPSDGLQVRHAPDDTLVDGHRPDAHDAAINHQQADEHPGDHPPSHPSLGDQLVDENASEVSNYFDADPYDGAFELEVGEDDATDPGLLDAQVTGSPRDMPFADYTEFFCFYFLRGQAGVTQAQYDIMRAFIQDILPGATPPSLSHIKRELLPRVRTAWGLPLRVLPTDPEVVEDAQPPHLLVVLPSDHVARDFCFAETFSLFTAADQRSDAERALHPEFCDSPLFQDRTASTMAGETVKRFVLDEEMLCCGDVVVVELTGGAGRLSGVTVGAGSFSSSEAGLLPGTSVHAGDFVVPCMLDGSAVGSLVVRHWRRADNNDVCWVFAGGRVVGVSKVQLVPLTERSAPSPGSEHPPRPRRLLSDIGPGGERRYTVSFALYSDDFDGMGGVYMSYVSWLFKHRMSRNGGRVLSLTERGVSSDMVLRAVMHDFAVGAHQGWVVEDPDGVKVRVFADVAFYVGDYEQVSKTSHLRGHNARAPCNLCAYANRRGALGSVYAQQGTSEHIGLARTTARTVAIVQAAEAADENGLPL